MFRRLNAAGKLFLSARGLPAPAAGDRAARHAPSERLSVFACCDQALAQPFDPALNRPPLFRVFPAGTTLAEMRRHTRLFVFIGAALSPELAAVAADPDTLALVFEPNPAAFEAYCRALPIEAAGWRIVHFVGDPAGMDVPLLVVLPEEVCDFGFPAVLVQEPLARACPDYCAEIQTKVEVFHYRHRILPVISHHGTRALPFRDIRREVFFDQLVHFYRNIADQALGGRVDDLAGLTPGATAILVGAGPALTERIEYIRANRDRAVVIAVNNALRPLLAQGIEPHFALVFDASLRIAADSFAGLPRLPDAHLVAHCFAATGGGIFKDVFFFDNYVPGVFSPRKALPAHASVLIAAFSLARLMGCTRTVLVGAQFSSPFAGGFEYAKGSAHHRALAEDGTAARHPWQYPVRTASGKQFYTLLAFLDAALWFCDEIATSRMEVVNLCADTIVHGANIRILEDCPLPADPGLAGRLANVHIGRKGIAVGGVRAYVLGEIEQWRGVQRTAKQVLAGLDDPAGDLGRLAPLLQNYDAANVSFLLERFEEFSPQRFAELYLHSQDPASRRQGLAHYFGCLKSMSRLFLDILAGELRKLKPLDTGLVL